MSYAIILKKAIWHIVLIHFVAPFIPKQFYYQSQDIGPIYSIDYKYLNEFTA